MNQTLEVLQQEIADAKFDPSHIRPSACGTDCLRQEALKIMNAVYGGEYQPTEESGREQINGTARLGDIVEHDATNLLKEIFKREHKRIFPQYKLPAPNLTNIDGTPVVAHPDIYVPSENLDIEIKTVSVDALGRLPLQKHVDQLLLRLLWWQKSKKKVTSGEIMYFFRETYYEPHTTAPRRYFLKPVEGGFNLLFREKVLDFYTFEYVEGLEERLFLLKDYVLKKELPERAESAFTYPCYVRKENYTIICPWRSFCWQNELDQEDVPGELVPEAYKLLQSYNKAKEKLRLIEDQAREARQAVKELQFELDPYFDQYGEKITAGEFTLSRTEVTVAEKTVPGYTYFRYSLRRT